MNCLFFKNIICTPITIRINTILLFIDLLRMTVEKQNVEGGQHISLPFINLFH